MFSYTIAADILQDGEFFKGTMLKRNKKTKTKKQKQNKTKNQERSWSKLHEYIMYKFYFIAKGIFCGIEKVPCLQQKVEEMTKTCMDTRCISLATPLQQRCLKQDRQFCNGIMLRKR